MRLSVVLPAYNEANNLVSVVSELMKTLDDLGIDFEILVVDDGSTDGTRAVVADLTSSDRRVRGIRLRRNFGKATALHAGFMVAVGEIIVVMDADGQLDPRDIPALLEEIDAGADLVSGRGTKARSAGVRRVASRWYNRVTARMTGVRTTDLNSGIRAMRREVAASLHLYGELHRFIPVLAHWYGFRVAEVPVSSRPRLHGRSKFGRARYHRGLLDLLTVKLITTYDARPLHLFGGVALVLGIAGTVLLTWMAVLSVTGSPVGDRPALLAGALLVMVAVQLVSIGLLAELIIHARIQPDVGSLIDERP